MIFGELCLYNIGDNLCISNIIVVELRFDLGSDLSFLKRMSFVNVRIHLFLLLIYFIWCCELILHVSALTFFNMTESITSVWTIRRFMMMIVIYFKQRNRKIIIFITIVIVANSNRRVILERLRRINDKLQLLFGGDDDHEYWFNDGIYFVFRRFSQKFV